MYNKDSPGSCGKLNRDLEAPLTQKAEPHAP
jgi:hypothetical protein